MKQVYPQVVSSLQIWDIQALSNHMADGVLSVFLKVGSMVHWAE